MTATPTGSSYALQQPPPPQKKPSGCKIVAAGCAVVFVAFCAFIAVLAVVVFGAMRRTDAYRTGFQRATNDPRVKAALGAPIEAVPAGRRSADSDVGPSLATIHLSTSGTSPT